MNKNILLVILSLLIISCTNYAQEDSVYKVLNTVFEQLDHDLKIRLAKDPKNTYLQNKLNNLVYINPKFLHLSKLRSPETLAGSFNRNSNFWILGYTLKINHCKELDYHDLKLFKDSIYYINQIKKAPDSLNLKKITHKRIRHYKTELEEIKHIKYYESWIEQSIDSVTLHNRKRLMLGEENKHFRISYPVFSKDNKYALVYIEKNGLGMQLWILQKESERWKRACVTHIGTIN